MRRWQALARSKAFAADEYRLRIAVPEDLILFKLQSWRRQDQADIERILKERRTWTSGRRVVARPDPERHRRAMRERWDEIRGTA